jgi:2-polyprenyl-3-methyl-5-hydroxy-6-metoxy-1,4-benzoquinol methylase
MPHNTWSSFWERPNDAFNSVMKVATDFFYKELRSRYPLKPGDSVLDYGCGPGFLVNNFVNAGVDVTGADINEHFLQQNKTRFPQADFIRMSGRPEATFDKRFDQVILLSIVQYFSSLDDVEYVVRYLKDYLKPGGKLIVADVLDEHTSPVRDALGIFVQCVRRGRVIAFARFILYLILSDYRQTSKSNKLLLVSSDFVKQMADRCSMRVEVVKDMTPHPTRCNYILNRKE